MSTSDRFDAIVDAMPPHLWAVNLSGMHPGGLKILTFGEGMHERQMLQALLDAGLLASWVTRRVRT